MDCVCREYLTICASSVRLDGPRIESGNEAEKLEKRVGLYGRTRRVNE